MIAVDEALRRILSLVQPMPAEEVPLTEAGGRVLAEHIRARRDQPPFAASAMDGYAVREADARAGARLTVVGEAAAGARYVHAVAPGEAVRIFTGAPVPRGADRVVIQEDTERDGDTVIVSADPGPAANVRPAAADFRIGDSLPAPRRLSPADVALIAAMNVPRVPVIRAPRVALVATGDELVEPGTDPGPDQIVASNSYGLFALLRAAGAAPELLPIVGDDEAALRAAFAPASTADLIVTIGGASVGDHDLVGTVAAAMGMERAFYRIAMRPGKPLMAGRLNGVPMVGLPGNPVSAMVCGLVFLRPLVGRMLGLPGVPAPTVTAPLAAPLPANGPRQHYMRGRCASGGVEAFPRQDSSLLSVLSAADCLIVRPPGDPARDIGAPVEILRLDR